MSSGDVLLITAVVLVPAALLWIVFLARTGKPGRPAVVLGIPKALRPGAPDEVLEGRRLESIQVGWILSTIALAVFIPAYWLPERGRQESFAERFTEETGHRGALIYNAPPDLPEEANAAQFKEAERAISLGQACSNCHGSGLDLGDPNPDLSEVATGGVAQPCNVCPTDPTTNTPLVKYQAPPLQNVFQRWDEEVIRFTIERGRPGTPMPAWSVDYGGSMTPQMIDSVIAWLKTLPGNQNPPPQLSESCQNLPSPSPSPSGTEGGDETGEVTSEPGLVPAPSPSPSPPDPESLRCGQEIFEARCAVCHGPQGQGKEEPLDLAPQQNPEATWYQGLALWQGDVRHLPEELHLQTIINGRRFAFMPAFGEAPAQGIPVPQYPLTDAQIEAVMQYERTL